MTRRLSIVGTTALMALATTSAAAQETGDAARGLAFARANCARCHGVVGAVSPREECPTFSDIANTRGMTALALAVWFQTPHPSMPNLMLDTADRDDVIAYILSLKAKRSQ
jgi:mono/diheme cytochrome c family protein